jgi:hypothetical protein
LGQANQLPGAGRPIECKRIHRITCSEGWTIHAF